MGDDVSNIIKESIDQVLQNQQYVPVKVRAAALFPFPLRERTSRALTAGTLAGAARRRLPSARRRSTAGAR